MQQAVNFVHHKLMKFIRFPFSYQYLAIFAFLTVFLTGCNIVKKESKAPTLLTTENASQQSLMDEVNRFARVNSMRAKMDLKFEDNSFAQFGSKEVYRSADAEVVVQRPANILLKVQLPIIKTDLAQMTSDGTKFRVAVLRDDGSGKFKKFVLGTNDADYSELQRDLNKADLDHGKELKQNVNAFANLRPQHFTEAMLVRPTNPTNAYAASTIFQIEEDETQPPKSPLRRVMRGYYLLDEYAKNSDGNLKILRRFWFDRVGGIRLARQQIFDNAGEIDSDIVYGKQGNLTDTGEYNNLPLRIQVTRPKEKYTMSLTYQTPEAETIGKTYPEKAFVLQNTWGLEEVDLDKKLQEVRAQKPTGNSGNNQNSATRFH
jgi:hypothetical protein